MNKLLSLLPVALLVVNAGCLPDTCTDPRNGVHEVTTTSGLQALARCETIEGQVNINGVDGGIDIEDVVFENLVSFTDDILVRSVDGLRSVSFPRLERGFNITFEQSGSLTTVELPSLVELRDPDEPNVPFGGTLGFFFCGGLDTVSAPELSTVGSLNFLQSGPAELELPSLSLVTNEITFRNAQIESFRVPALDEPLPFLDASDNLFLLEIEAPEASISELNVRDNPELTLLDLSGTTSSNITIRDNALAELRLDALTTAVQMRVERSAGLERLSAPNLTSVPGGSLVIDGNPVLVEIDLPSLTSVDSGVRIDNNPLLPDCEAEAVYDAVDFADTPQNNLGDGCPPS